MSSAPPGAGKERIAVMVPNSVSRPSSPVEDVDPDATAGDGAPSRAYWRQLSVAVRSGRFKDDDARHAVPAQLQRTASYR